MKYLVVVCHGHSRLNGKTFYLTQDGSKRMSYLGEVLMRFLLHADALTVTLVYGMVPHVMRSAHLLSGALKSATRLDLSGSELLAGDKLSDGDLCAVIEEVERASEEDDVVIVITRSLPAQQLASAYLEGHGAEGWHTPLECAEALVIDMEHPSSRLHMNEETPHEDILEFAAEQAARS